VQKFNHLLSSFPGYRIVCDITGGDKSVSDALLYAALLSGNKDAIIVYVKRAEHGTGDEKDIIQFPQIPSITDRQREFMKKLGDGKGIGEMAMLLSTSRSNAWNLANALQDEGIVRIEKQSEMVLPSFPGNIYAMSEG
jgi:hypothetical protein